VAGSRRRAFLGGVISSAASIARAVVVVDSLVRDESAGRAGQVLADGGPGAAGTGPDEAHQQQGQPAEQHVGADALFAAVIDRARSSEWAVRSRQPRSTCSSCWCSPARCPRQSAPRCSRSEGHVQPGRLLRRSAPRPLPAAADRSPACDGQLRPRLGTPAGCSDRPALACRCVPSRAPTGTGSAWRPSTSPRREPAPGTPRGTCRSSRRASSNQPAVGSVDGPSRQLRRRLAEQRRDLLGRPHDA
jgi:hypothetical protein